MATTTHDPPVIHDLTDLEAPEPFVRSVELAMLLEPGESARVRTPRVPRALLVRLVQRGFLCSVDEEPAGTATATISRHDPSERGA